MGTAQAGVHPQGQHLRLPPGQDFELHHKTRADPVADEIGELLLLVQRVSHAAHVAIATLQQRFTGREAWHARAAAWPIGPDQRSGNQQLVSIVDPPEGFGVAPHVRVVDLHQAPMGRLHGGLGGAPGELQDG
jgi:hypothetical protein